jgi:hypothetical protein
MDAIPLGAKGRLSMIVAPEHLANRFKDPTLLPVLATPTDDSVHGERCAKRHSRVPARRVRARHSRQHQAPCGDAGRTCSCPW